MEGYYSIINIMFEFFMFLWNEIKYILNDFLFVFIYFIICVSFFFGVIYDIVIYLLFFYIFFGRKSI